VIPTARWNDAPAVRAPDLLYLIRGRVNWRTRVQAGPLRAAFFPGVYNVFNIQQHKKFSPTPAKTRNATKLPKRAN